MPQKQKLKKKKNSDKNTEKKVELVAVHTEDGNAFRFIATQSDIRPEEEYSKKFKNNTFFSMTIKTHNKIHFGKR